MRFSGLLLHGPAAGLLLYGMALAGCRAAPVSLGDGADGPGPGPRDGGGPGADLGPPPPPPEPAWHWESPLPQGNNLRGVFAVAGAAPAQDELYAVGDGSTLLQRVAGVWQVQVGPQNQQGAGLTSLLAVQGSGSGPLPQLLAVGAYDGAALRDGGQWNDDSQDLGGFGIGTLNGVWGSRVTGEYFVVGTAGRIYHVRGGVSWQREGSGLTTLSLQGVWGRGAGTGQEVFAVGASGTVLHGKNGQWSAEAPGLLAQGLNAVSGSDNGDGTFDVYAVGDSGVLAHRQGGSWFAETAPTSQGLYGVWAQGSDVYAVGGHGTVLHRSGGSWKVEAAGLTSDLLSAVTGTVHGTKVTVYAVGNLGTVLQGGPDGWSMLSSRVSSGALSSVWARSPDEVYAVGPDGTIVRRSGGASNGTWTQEGADVTGEALNSVTGWAPGSSGDAEVYAVGSGGTILHRVMGTWMVEGAVLTGEELLGVWVGPDAAFVVGRSGRIARKQGGVWSLEQGSNGMGVVNTDLYSVWGTGQGDALVVYASGAGGVILRRAQGAWAVEGQGTTAQSLTAIFGRSAEEVYAVGPQGVALRRQGGQWFTESLGQPNKSARALAGCAVPAATICMPWHRTAPSCTAWARCGAPICPSLRSRCSPPSPRPDRTMCTPWGQAVSSCTAISRRRPPCGSGACGRRRGPAGRPSARRSCGRCRTGRTWGAGGTATPPGWGR